MSASVPILVGNAGICLNFYAPAGVEELLDDDHGGGGTDDGEELAMDAADDLPVVSVGEVHAGAVDVLDGGAGVLESGGDDVEALFGLRSDVSVVCADGASAGDVNFIADADGAGEADDGLVGGGTGDVGAGHLDPQRRSEEPCRA